MAKINYLSTLKKYYGKRVLITGHTGFKGSWLTLLMIELGAHVKGYSLKPNTEPNHFDLLKLEDDIDHVIGDIRDYNSLLKCINDFKPEIVFHLAAQPLVKKSYEEPLLTLDTNIMGTANLLEAVANCESVKSLVCITSDKCYENYEWIWGYRENDTLGGHDPYSSSKAAAEIIFSSYQRSFFEKRKNLGAGTTRAGNVIGGGDWSDDRLIPDCIKAIESNDSINIRSPLSTRPWQHVLEPLSGYILLGIKLLEDPKFFSGAWNFGPSQLDSMTVKEVVVKMTSFFKHENVLFEENNKNNVHEAGLLQLNCDKAIQYLKWNSRWNSIKSLEATSEWFKVFMSNGNIREKTLGQIYEYFEELK